MRTTPPPGFNDAEGVAKKLKMPVRTIREMARKGTFPLPVKLTPRRSVWPDSDIDAWLASRVAERDAAAGGGQ